MDRHLLIELITVPLFTGVIGYITNWTGVLMLFKTVGFHGFRVPGLHLIYPFFPRRVQVLPVFGDDGRKLGWQGMVPSRADKMASLAVDTGIAKFGTVGDFFEEMDTEALSTQFTKLADEQLEAIVDRIIQRENPDLWHILPTQLKDAVYARIREQLPENSKLLTKALSDNIEQLVDVKQMVIRYFTQYPQLLNQVFLIMGRKELTFMQNFGFYFGFPMGFLTVGVLEFVVRAWWVLPLCGILIGWTVNWIGVNLIFWPPTPRWYIPWRRGLLLRRQSEITEMYAKMIAERVLTLENFGRELMTGPRADRTMSLLEETLRPTVDRAVGPARLAVKVAVGSQEYERMKASIGPEFSSFAPQIFENEEINKEQAANIREFIAARMRVMAPAEFVNMLRSAIKQDEWLLFLHGGVLGAFAGLLHLAIFGL